MTAWVYGYYGFGGWLPIALIAAMIIVRMVGRSRATRPPGSGPGNRPPGPGVPGGTMGFGSTNPGPRVGGTFGGNFPGATVQGPAAGSAGAPGSRATSRGIPPGWMVDPTGRFDQRYWSGTAWTEHVVKDGVPANDPPPSWSARREDPGKGSPDGATG